MIGCERPPLESKNNNVTVKSSPSAIIPQKSDDLNKTFNLMSSAYSDFKKSINKLNADLKKFVDNKLKEEQVNFSESNKKLTKLKQVVLEFKKELNRIENNSNFKQSLNKIEKQITDIEKVIKPLQKGLNNPVVRELQKLIELKKNTNISPTGIFKTVTQKELDKFLSQRIKNLDQEFEQLKKVIQKRKNDANNLTKNPQPKISPSPNPETVDQILISKSELDSIYKRINLIVSVNIIGFMILCGLFTWLLYKLNMAETQKKPSYSSNNKTKLGNIENYIQGQFTQTQQNLENLDTRIRKLEIDSQNPQNPNLSSYAASSYTASNNQPFNTPVNQVINPQKPQQPQVRNIYNSQISNHETQIVVVYNTQPRSLSANAITVAESDDTIEQRRIGRTIAPILEEKQLGNYWIIQEGNYEYLLPKGNIKINEYNYETISNCFECLGYNPSYSTSFTLLKPATVSSIGQNWQLIEPGKLQFQ